MSVTSAEVARAAGVSRATVSYVLNDAPGQTISPATRETVQRVARELGYRPSASARSLRSGKGQSVLFPLPGLAGNHVTSQLVGACATALQDVGLTLVPDHATYAGTDEQLDAWLRLAPCAVIDTAIRRDDPILEALRRHRVSVLSSALPDSSEWESAGDAFARAVRKTQVLHLLDQGCRDIVLIAPPQLPGDPRVGQRLLRLLKQLAVSRDATLSVVRLPLEPERVRALVGGWATGPRPDAVATYDDDYALAILTALLHAGIRVPEDVRVIGVDDAPLSRVVTPALTTLAADFAPYALGVANAVLHAVKGGLVPPPLPVPGHRVVVRESA